MLSLQFISQNKLNGTAQDIITDNAAVQLMGGFACRHAIFIQYLVKQKHLIQHRWYFAD